MTPMEKKPRQKTCRKSLTKTDKQWKTLTSNSSTLDRPIRSWKKTSRGTLTSGRSRNSRGKSLPSGLLLISSPRPSTEDDKSLSSVRLSPTTEPPGPLKDS
ncbi:uncharacterized protein CTRU02_211723 [Colletotrichum truncatum]|uniref:Uncharacterized protein n=1 Tax=Colletotrichum truncatum TaxID=5467 RepID=A0ACC3YLH4_COLTU